MPSGTLIIRADASVAMGTGHVMRCLALAQAWRDQASGKQSGRCVFVTAEITPALEERMRAEKFDVSILTAPPATPQDGSELAQIAISESASWVVVDGYQFDVEYQRILKSAGLKLLLIDDTGHAGNYVADLVLDQNAHASENLYQHRESYTRLLLGPRYALLRSEFKPWREWKREIAPSARKILITMGGSDPQNITLRVIQALKLVSIEGIEAAVVAGGSNPHFKSLEDATAGRENIRLHSNVANMADLMAWADVAFSAAGTICWEICLLGLPAILVDLAENQRPVAEDLQQKGVAIYLGTSEDISEKQIAAKLEWLLGSPDVRAGMSQRGQQLVDGAGAERVVSAMLNAEWRLRHAQPADVDLLWQWTNDPDVRAASFSSGVITQEGHQEWFNKKLSDPNAIIFLALDGADGPVGVVRYDLDGARALISISLARGFRGKGRGKTLLTLAVEALFRDTKTSIIDAYIRPTNEASLQLFTRAGFLREGSAVVSDQPAIHFTLERR
jgi:UDP-2,4-diacetamido-2,4,6-trideoxy-beta-L-altropyranose hydrolase